MEQSQGIGKLFNADGNAPDPEGGDLRGLSSGYNFANGAIGTPELVFQAKDGREVTFNADVFDDHVHIPCPICALGKHEHGLMVRKGVKAWTYDPMAQAPTFPGWESARMMIAYPRGTGGQLSMDPVKCPWGKHQFSIKNNVVRAE